MDIENKYEASFDLNPESVENLKDILHSEIEEVSKRFNNGTETLDDLINNYRHLKIKFEMKNGTEQDLDVVELKYYKKLIEEIKKQQNITNDMAEQMAGLTIWNNEKEEPLILMDQQEVIDHFTNKYEEGK